MSYKIHLFKKLPNGKLNVNSSECGRGHFTKNGAPNVIYKSNAFRSVFEEEGEKVVCSVCLNRAKDQKRV